MRTLSIDIETFSSIDLTKSGVHKYISAPDFSILLLAYAYDDDPVTVLDLANGDEMPFSLYIDLTSARVIKTAFNAAFELTCLQPYVTKLLDLTQWRCTMVHALYTGLPASLDAVSKALNLNANKDTAGKALIKYFSCPCKPTASNGFRNRNLPEHNPEKWDQYKAYNMQDVVVERQVRIKLEQIYRITDFEQRLWALDYKINGTGIQLNRLMMDNAIACDERNKDGLMVEAKKISGLENPKSAAQIKKYLSTYEGVTVESLNKNVIDEVYERLTDPKSKKLLDLYKELGKTSTAKYLTMRDAILPDDRIKGLLQFNGASRTGRWAGRMVQVHNLPRNYMPTLDTARNFLLAGDYDILNILYPSVSNVLSELIRTTFVAKDGCRFVVSDFSAIEARVIAWVAGEQWRLDVFNTHGKIYEASASQMFKIPLDQITKDLRQKGKVAELALGYQGGAGALVTMGALKMGLQEEDLPDLVAAWRQANPYIVSLWKRVNDWALQAVDKKTTVKGVHGLVFHYRLGNLYITLPSGRDLCYMGALVGSGAKFGNPVIKFKGVNQTTKQWEVQETYGGKLVENIVQAIARDCLAETLVRFDTAGYDIVMHVHDEVVLEVDKAFDCMADVDRIMAERVAWAQGLPLKGASFESDYYLKD